jgi:hypothetical protein
MLYLMTFEPTRGPFTLEDLREADRWAAELLAWGNGARSIPPDGTERVETKPPP